MAVDLFRCCLQQWYVCLRLSELPVLGWIPVLHLYAIDEELLASLQ